jgi:hypothetical protein
MEDSPLSGVGDAGRVGGVRFEVDWNPQKLANESRKDSVFRVVLIWSESRNRSAFGMAPEKGCGSPGTNPGSILAELWQIWRFPTINR